MTELSAINGDNNDVALKTEFIERKFAINFLEQILFSLLRNF